MKKLAVVFLAFLCIAYDAYATNYIKILNQTKEPLKVGLIKSAINFAVLHVDPQTTRDYNFGQEQDCLKQITINGKQMWAGNNCDNYEIVITKEADMFSIKFNESSVLKAAPFDPSQGINMS
ncbi:MAG: hypothetical protein AB7F19_04785 [Candidatus Babeliales bacterium]